MAAFPSRLEAEVRNRQTLIWSSYACAQRIPFATLDWRGAVNNACCGAVRARSKAGHNCLRQSLCDLAWHLLTGSLKTEGGERTDEGKQTIRFSTFPKVRGSLGLALSYLNNR